MIHFIEEYPRTPASPLLSFLFLFVCLFLCCSFHHESDSCIIIGSNESHFNVSLIVRDNVTRQCPETTSFEEKGEPKAVSNRSPSAYQPNALPLGQTGWFRGRLSQRNYQHGCFDCGHLKRRRSE